METNYSLRIERERERHLYLGSFPCQHKENALGTRLNEVETVL